MHHFTADLEPDPSFYYYADPNPTLYFNADPKPAPHQGDADLRPLAYRTSTAPLGASTVLHCPILASKSKATEF
jgi:hypothetical protein